MTTAPVLCPLDGEPAAERALATAVHAAATLQSPLELFSGVEDLHEVAQREQYLRRVACGLPHRPVTVSVAVAPHPPRAIAEEAALAGLVVMATSAHPLLHHGYFGSAAETVIRSIDRPGIFIGPRCTLPLSEVKRIVVPCDGSALAEQVLPDALAWSQLLDVPVWLVTVVDPEGGGEVDDVAEHGYVQRLASRHGAEWEVLHGDDPARALAQWADDALIAMSSHGRSGISRLTIGSVTAGTTRWAAGPVMVRCASVSG